MKSITIELSDDQHAFVRRMVESGGYAGESDFFREMLTERQVGGDRESVDQLLLQGLEGPAVTLDADEMDRIWRRARERGETKRRELSK